MSGDSLEHWHYFMALESDLANTTRYVEPTPANMNTYSIEFVRILLAACSEIDVVCRVLCKSFDPQSDSKHMGSHRNLIHGQFPNLHTMKVIVGRAQATLEPWASWANNADPKWWIAHNKVKHERHESFQRATMEACFDAVGGLLVVVLYLYHRQLFRFGLDVQSLKLLAIEHMPGNLVTSGYVLPDTLPRSDPA